jgi:heme-degrading monooxygenase HmoA
MTKQDDTLPRPEALAPAGFAVIYRWRVRPEAEEAFADAWRTVTQHLKTDRGSLGARLHKGDDGIWYSYAQWPSRNARVQAFAQGDVDPVAQDVMRLAVLEHLPEILLTPVADVLG